MSNNVEAWWRWSLFFAAALFPAILILAFGAIEFLAEAQSKYLFFNIQRELQDRGLYTGPVDGPEGPWTEAAILEFGRAAGLTMTGKARRGIVGELGTILYSLPKRGTLLHLHCWPIGAGWFDVGQA